MKVTLGTAVLTLLLVALSPRLSSAQVANSPPQATPPFYPDKTKLLVWRDSEGKQHPIQTAADWAKRRAHILAGMELVMGALPDAQKKVPLDIQIIEEMKTDKFVRRKLTFAVEKAERVPAYLLIPAKLDGKRPAVLCLHQTTRFGKNEPAGLEGNPRLHYALHLAERGYVTLAPDYPNYGGEYKVDPYKQGYASATMKGIWNHMRAIDLLRSLPQVDPERIGVIGHSLGGHNSMFVAAFDPRIKCIVSNCGFASLPSHKTGIAGWSWYNTYMPRIRTVYDTKVEKMPFDFPEVVAALAPRPFLASSPIFVCNFDVDGVKVCIAAGKPVYDLFDAGEKLAANHPDCGHDFPPEAREVAYRWLDRWLKEE